MAKKLINIFEESVDYIKQLGNDSVNSSMALANAIEKDTIRIAKWASSTQGVLWALEQKALAKSGPMLETVNGLPPGTRIFDPIQTLSNVSTAPLGFHTGNTADYSYEEVMKEKIHINKGVQESSASNSRLIKLGAELGSFDYDIPSRKSGVNNNTNKKSSIVPNNPNSMKSISGAGGPNSFYGIGRTDFNSSTSGNPLPKISELTRTYQLYPGWSEVHPYVITHNTNGSIGYPNKTHFDDDLENTESLYNKFNNANGGKVQVSSNGFKQKINNDYTIEHGYIDGVKNIDTYFEDNIVNPNSLYNVLKKNTSKIDISSPITDPNIKTNYNVDSIYSSSVDNSKSLESYNTKYKSDSPDTDFNRYGDYTKGIAIGESPTVAESDGLGNKIWIDEFATIDAYKSMAAADTPYFQKWNMVKRVGMSDFVGIGNIKNTSDRAYDINHNVDKNGGIDIHKEFNDFVKFKFDGGNMDSNFKGNDTGLIQFRCTVTGVNMTTNPKWNQISYVGRPDDVAIFTGVDRKVSLQFIVSIQSRDEYVIAWKKINNLHQKVSPKVINGKMSGPFLKFTYGSLYVDEPAYINSLSVTIGDEYPWDLITERPYLVSISTELTIIGTSSPSSEKIYF